MARHTRGYQNSVTPPSPTTAGHWNSNTFRQFLGSGGTGTWDMDNLSGQIPSIGNITNPTQNDYAEWTVYLLAGTYNMRVPTVKTSASGIATFTLDGGASLGTSDLYNATTGLSTASINNIVVATPGWHTLRVIAATKNASSTGYAMRFANDFLFIKTA